MREGKEAGSKALYRQDVTKTARHAQNFQTQKIMACCQPYLFDHVTVRTDAWIKEARTPSTLDDDGNADDHDHCER